MFELTPRDNMLLRGLHPDLQRVIRRAAQIAPFPFRITEGLRTAARQEQLVKSGASKTLNSRHLTGHAIDLVPLVDIDGDGKFESNELYHWPLYYRLAPAIKQAAKDEGVPIEWGGDWRSFKDGPHWQLPWSKYPTKAAGLVGTPMSGETEFAARAKEGGVVAALGSAASAPVLPDVIDSLTSQQSELTSGDWLRMAVAAAILGLTLYGVYRKVFAK